MEKLDVFFSKNLLRKFFEIFIKKNNFRSDPDPFINDIRGYEDPDPFKYDMYREQISLCDITMITVRFFDLEGIKKMIFKDDIISLPCRGLGIKGQLSNRLSIPSPSASLSQSSPTPSLSTSSCSAFSSCGQLSVRSGTPSRSESNPLSQASPIRLWLMSSC